MKFVIVGAGATGGFLGARLARADADVTLVARGPHLEAMRANGVRVISAGDDCLTVKAHALTDLAPRLGPLLGPDTAVVTAQNGIPWWYFDCFGDGPLAGTRLHSADPGAAIVQSIETRRVIGCVVYPATQLVAPGVIEHLEGTRFSIGEPDGSKSDRCQAIAAALVRAGLKCPIRTRIRHDLWLKLLGNVAFNPISALTRATLVDIATHPETRAAARAVMEEADSVARALGVELDIGVDQRLAGAEKVGAHKTSMLQDVETCRPLEVEAVLGTVVEIGDLLGLELPHLRTIYACTQLLDLTLRRS
jgi:2-dehydropantoate 2-reductase